MTLPHAHPSTRNDQTLLKLVVAVVIAVMLNAGITAYLVLSTQSRFSIQQAQQQTQGKMIVERICDTLESLHADEPPVGAEPSRVYLQDLHARLGDLAYDLKC